MIKADKNTMLVIDNDDKTCENMLVRRVLEELKNKKLLKNPKSSYKSTEKILYSLKVLPEAVRLIDKEIESLKEEAKGISIPTAKSNTLVLNEKDGTYVYGDEILETRISELEQISVKTKSQIRLVNNALKKIEDNEYYDIISMYYFEGMTIEEIAEELGCATGTISTNKKKLIDKLKVYIFPDTFMNEL